MDYGDYYDKVGTHISNDGNDDNKAYVRDKNGTHSFGTGVWNKLERL